jgi:hypothetical protein
VSELKDVVVICRRRPGREVIYQHDAKYVAGPQLARPGHEELINDAKTELTNRRLAFPPYADVEFAVEWP